MKNKDLECPEYELAASMVYTERLLQEKGSDTDELTTLRAWLWQLKQKISWATDCLDDSINETLRAVVKVAATAHAALEFCIKEQSIIEEKRQAHLEGRCLEVSLSNQKEKRLFHKEVLDE